MDKNEDEDEEEEEEEEEEDNRAHLIGGFLDGTRLQLSLKIALLRVQLPDPTFDLFGARELHARRALLHLVPELVELDAHVGELQRRGQGRRGATVASHVKNFQSLLSLLLLLL